MKTMSPQGTSGPGSNLLRRGCLAPEIFGMILVLLVAWGSPAACYGNEAPSLSPGDLAIVELVKEFADSGASWDWVQANSQRLTPDLVEAVNDAARRSMADRALNFAHAAKLLVAYARLNGGDSRGSLSAQIDACELEEMMANSLAQYDEVRSGALALRELAAKVKARDLEARAALLAADASYFAALEVKEQAARRPYEERILDDLIQAAAIAVDLEAGNLEKFASLTQGVLADALSELFYSGQGREERLRRLAPHLERGIPVDFAFRMLKNKSPEHDTLLASSLAELSYSYGNAAIASARLAHAETKARARGEVEATARLLSMRYRGERSQGRSALQLYEVRDRLEQDLATLRGRYFSRTGRLWVATLLDYYLTDLVRDELESEAKLSARAFRDIESVKARFLLDELDGAFTPITGAADLAQATAIERQVLSYPDCGRTFQEMTLREMLLVSRVPIAVGDEIGKDLPLIDQAEALYKKAQAGFRKVAAPASLREVQGALAPDEVLVEYFIPYHPLHPAKDLWILVITGESTKVLRQPLETLLAGSKFVGSISVDKCPPVDASPLGDAVAGLRVALQRSDEPKALEYLRWFHDVLIAPILKSGLDTRRYSRWIVVPHGPLHYLPFAALRDPGGRFLVQEVALTMAPSASVWHRLEKKRWAAPKVAAGFFSPRLPDAPLGPATREIDGFKNGLPGAKVLVYPDLEASEERFMEVAPQAEWLHLSTHGEFPERNANEFHEIRLVPSKGYDGHLQALEIKSLDLHRTSLVVLAICNGGLYSVGPADEPYGLMPAFLASGAGNVVGTLWPLDNEFGKEYMVRYYKQLGRLGPARAQQATARSFIDEKEMVLHWAGFVTVGPGRPFQ